MTDLGKRTLRRHLRDRFYVRGWTWLGIFNTLFAALCNRVVVKHCVLPVRYTVERATSYEAQFPRGG
jgi:hypothetical protein